MLLELSPIAEPAGARHMATGKPTPSRRALESFQCPGTFSIRNLPFDLRPAPPPSVPSTSVTPRPSRLSNTKTILLTAGINGDRPSPAARRRPGGPVGALAGWVSQLDSKALSPGRGGSLLMHCCLLYGHGPQLARSTRRSDTPTSSLPSKSAGQPLHGPQLASSESRSDAPTTPSSSRSQGHNTG